MKKPERVTLDHRIERISTDWFFKTSEGLKGPFDSRETARSILESFVAQCKEDVSMKTASCSETMS